MTIIRNEQLSVTVDPQGAELKSIAGRDGREWLWNGDARYWMGRAPILFPAVGVSADNTVKIGGRAFPMGKHGFARNSTFQLVRSANNQCLFRLSENETTLQSFPFRFSLDIAFELQGPALNVAASVKNLSADSMPFGFGFHPAFVWPLPGCEGLPHRCWLDTDEEPRTRRLDANGFLQSDAEPSVFKNGVLALDHRLFDRDAVILDQLRSRAVSFGVPDRSSIGMAFDGFAQFGIWTKPGAPFLCLEPWHGMAPEKGGDIDMETRPGAVRLAPNDTKSFVMRVTFPL